MLITFHWLGKYRFHPIHMFGQAPGRSKPEVSRAAQPSQPEHEQQSAPPSYLPHLQVMQGQQAPFSAADLAAHLQHQQQHHALLLQAHQAQQDYDGEHQDKRCAEAVSTLARCR